MYGPPPLPSDAILGLAERYGNELSGWQRFPVESTKYWDQKSGTWKYAETFLEYWGPPTPYSPDASTTHTQMIERYIVKTELVAMIVRAKVMEKALEGYNP